MAELYSLTKKVTRTTLPNTACKSSDNVVSLLDSQAERPLQLLFF